MKIMETALPNNYSRELFENYNDLAPDHTPKITDIMFTAIAQILAAAKSKDHPTAFIIDAGPNKSFVMGAVCQFFENEDPKKPGNWSLVFTFNETDIPENAQKITIDDVQTHVYFRAVAAEKWRIEFLDTERLVQMFVLLAKCLRAWLDENAKEGEEVTIEQDGVFQARVAIENGEKVFAVEPQGEVKMIIKSDSSIEK